MNALSNGSVKYFLSHVFNESILVLPVWVCEKAEDNKNENMMGERSLLI